ncbi:MAG: 50S ribosomal protein L11 methyltransferase [Hyphomicrobiaceae bacterium]|nr:50S ribosomal protein L11 methyltransferase [Hyphomicrobiaceae bacterium]
MAIAAARSLRRAIVASDIDPISVKTALDNAALNEVGPLLEVIEASGLAHRKLQKNAPYDLLIANILAAPLLFLAPALKKALRPRGHLILSGLLRTQSRAIEARYKSQGFHLVKRLPLDEWMTLILRFK